MKKSCSLTFQKNDSRNRFDEHLSAREWSQPRHDSLDYGKPYTPVPVEQIQFLSNAVRDRTPPQNSSAAENS
jgi:hypothetical protein